MIKSISHTTVRHSNWTAMRTFYLDFGLVISHETADRIYFRGGAGPRPYLYIAERGDDANLVGISYEAESEAALRAFSQRFAAPVEQIETPWGGFRVATRDPDGNLIEIVWGIPEQELLPSRPSVQWNSNGKVNRLGRFPIFEIGPVPIIQLCHVVQQSPDPGRMIDWYVTQLGAYPSDILLEEDQKSTYGAFMRFPRGKAYVPHHSAAVFRGPPNQPQHVCFETIDLDAVYMGHRYLLERGHELGWGVVRHMLGGAISDYWHDPSGFRVEHVTDSDVLNDEFPTEHHIVGSGSLMQWGPELPGEFLE